MNVSHPHRIFIGVESIDISTGTSRPLFCLLGRSSDAIMYDGHHHLYLVSARTKSVLKSINISEYCIDLMSITYCEEHRSMFLFGKDGWLLVLRCDLTFLTKMNLGLRHAMDIRYIDKVRFLLVQFPNYLACLSLSISTNHRTARFPSAMFYEIEEISRRELPTPAFVKTIDVQHGQYIVMASLTDIMIYNIISDRLLVDMHKVAEPTNQLTAITLSPKMGYFIAGANQGQILIYKMQRYRRLVNAFQSHEKKIIALHVDRLENELLSASEDQTIRIFSLQSMQILQIFNCHQKYHQFSFISEERFLACYDNTSCIGSVSSKLQMLYQHNSYYECSISHNNTHIISLTNNSILLVSDTLEVTHGFSPPTCTQILQIDRNPFANDNDEYWLLTSNKEVYVYKISKTSSTPFTAVRIVSLREFVNLTGNINIFEIDTLKFMKLAPMLFDAEIKQNTHIKNSQSQQHFQSIAFGSSHGDVIIVSSLRISHIQSRVRFHKEPIVQINSLELNGKNLMISLCKANRLIISQLDPDREPLIVYKMNLGEQFARLFFENELFILTYKLGAFELCQFNGQKLTVRRPPANQLRVDHENIIVFASVDIKSQRLVTSSQDKTVKVWNLSAQYLFQVVLDGLVGWAILQQDKLIMLVGGGRLVYISDAHFKHYFQQSILPELPENEPMKQKQSQDQSFVSLPLISRAKSRSKSKQPPVFISRRRDLSQQHMLLRERSKISLYSQDLTHNTHSPKRRHIEGYESYFHLPDSQFMIKISRRHIGR